MCPAFRNAIPYQHFAMIYHIKPSGASGLLSVKRFVFYVLGFVFVVQQMPSYFVLVPLHEDEPGNNKM
jgi:hypothetical protein